MINSITKNKPVHALAKTEGIILTIMALAILWWQGSSGDAIAYFYGGSVAIAGTVLQQWRLLDAEKRGGLDAAINLRIAYLCMIERWLTIIVLLAIGFALLNLSAISLTVGFIVMQFVRIIGSLRNLKKAYG